MLSSSDVFAAVHQAVACARQWSIAHIQSWDGPHGDAYWIMSPEKTLAYLIKDGRILLTEVLEGGGPYHTIIESKFWADMLFAYDDPAESIQLGERLTASYHNGSVSFMPQIALIDPWRPHESILIQNNVVAAIEYRQMGIETLPIDYSADIFCVPTFKHWLDLQCGIEILFHTKGSSAELAANAVGIWQEREEIEGKTLTTFAMPKGYGAGERLGKPRGKKFVSNDGFRADDYIADLDEAAASVCEALQVAIEEVGHIYQRSGLTTMSYPIGVDYSVFNERLAPIVSRINELAGFEFIRVGSPMQLVKDIQAGLANGTVVPVRHAGSLTQGAYENKVRNVSLMRWPTELYPSWKMQQAFVRSQAVASLASWLTNYDYPYGVLRQQLGKVLLKVTHDEPCFVDPNSHHEMRGLAIGVMDTCHRQTAEALGVLARPHRPGRNEPRQNHLRYRNPDAAYAQVFTQLGCNTAMLELPATDGYKTAILPGQQSSNTNGNYWHAKQGGALVARTHDGKVLPVQIVKRQKGGYIRSYAAVEVLHTGIGAVELQVEPSVQSAHIRNMSSDTFIDNGRVSVMVNLDERRIEVRDQARHVNHNVWLRDGGNRGDAYTIDSLPDGWWDSREDESVLITSRLMASGPVFQELEVTFEFWLPASLAADAPGVQKRRQHRSETLVKNTVILTIRIYQKDRERIDLETVYDNQSRDHVMQLMIAPGDPSGTSRLREHKDIRYVSDFHAPLPTDVREKEYQRFDSGMLNIGSLLIMHPIKYHEVQRDEQFGAAVAIYLLTSTGFLSHGDLENRIGHTGGPGTRIDDAQCIGQSFMPVQLRVGADRLSDVDLWRRSQSFQEGVIQLAAPGIAATLNGKLVIRGSVARLSLKRMELERRGYIICLNNPSPLRDAWATFNVDVWSISLSEDPSTMKLIPAGRRVHFGRLEARGFVFGELT